MTLGVCSIVLCIMEKTYKRSGYIENQDCFILQRQNHEEKKKKASRTHASSDVGLEPWRLNGRVTEPIEMSGTATSLPATSTTGLTLQWDINQMTNRLYFFP